MPKQRRTEKTHPVTFRLWNDVVAPIVEYCDSEHGRRARLLEEFRKTIAPETVSRQIFDAWLAKPEHRTEPSLSNGLALMAAAGRLGVSIQPPQPPPPP